MTTQVKDTTSPVYIDLTGSMVPCTCEIPIGCLWVEDFIPSGQDFVAGKWVVQDCLCDDCGRPCSPNAWNWQRSSPSLTGCTTRPSARVTACQGARERLGQSRRHRARYGEDSLEDIRAFVHLEQHTRPITAVPAAREPSILERADGEIIIYAGKVSSVYGEPSGGKSWIGLMTAIEADPQGWAGNMVGCGG